MTENKHLQQNMSDYLALKQRLKNEISRRTGYGSMSTYASTTWNYSDTPTESSPIYGDYVKKLINPLLYIQDLTYAATRQDNSPIPDLTEIDQLLTKLEAEGKLDDSSSCRGACTGLCSKTCVETCTSCAGTCEGSCYTLCTTSCGSGCSTGCGVNCQGNCSLQCSNACAGICTTTCAQDCNVTCYTACTGCSFSCTGTCGGTCTAICVASCGSQAST